MCNREFRRTFTEEVTAPILRALAQAYETACDFHNEDVGSNALTFGVGVYHYAVHELLQMAADRPEIRANVRSDQVFRLRVRDFVVAVHRVGTDEDADISSSFPRNDGAVAELHRDQFWLPTLEPDLTRARQFVLAHLGNPMQGLVAAYLCVPSHLSQGQIRGWAWSEAIYRRTDFGPLLDLDAATTPPAVPDEVVDEPELQWLEEQEDEIDG